MPMLSNRLFIRLNLYNLQNIGESLHTYFHLEENLEVKIKKIIENDAVLINIKYVNKKTPFIEFSDLPLCLSNIINEYAYDYIEMDLYLNLCFILIPMYEQFVLLEWQVKSILHNLSLSVGAEKIYRAVVQHRNKILKKNKYKLFRYHRLSNKYLENEILSFITELNYFNFLFEFPELKTTIKD